MPSKPPNSKILLAKNNHNGKEVNNMKYERPEITFSVDAVEVIQGTKLSGPMDSGDMGNPIHTAGAYHSDE
jgi:hypothetical protein